MRLLVTGANGFIGSSVVDAARADGHEVVAWVHRGSPVKVRHVHEVLEGELGDGEAMRALGRSVRADAVIHLAWTIRRDFRDAPENLTCAAGSLELLRGLVERGCPRVVFAGSHLELAPSASPLDERADVRTDCVYAASKDAVRRVGEVSTRGGETSFAWARLFNVYGARAPRFSFVGEVVDHLTAGRTCAITRTTHQRTFMHVDDAARALLAIARTRQAGVVHVGSDEVVTLEDVGRRIARRFDREGLLRFGPVPDEATPGAPVVPDVTRLRSEIGFRSIRSLDEGIDAMVGSLRTESTP